MVKNDVGKGITLLVMLKTRPFAEGTVVPVSFLLYLVSFTVKSDKIDKEGNIDQGRRNNMLLFSTVLSSGSNTAA